MNNRAIFINFVNSMFEPYKNEIMDDTTEISCESIDKNKKKGFELLVHQKIVKDYMNVFSPYRGLLLYHGLGAGKTCASIAIAEGIKDHKKVIVLTPASLRSNYISEMKFCGDSIYKKNQYWKFIKVNGSDDDIIKPMSNVLNLPVAKIKENGGAWFVNMRKNQISIN